MGGDGSVSIAVDMDISQAEKELAKVKKSISELEKELAKSQEKKLPLEEQSKSLAASLDAAKAKLEEMKAATIGAFTKDDIADQRETVKGLQAQYNSVSSQVERYDREIEKASEKLKENTGRAEELAQTIKKAPPAVEETSKATSTLNKRLSTIVRKVFVFSLITAGLRSVRAYMSAALKTNADFTNALAVLKGALLTAFQPLWERVVPILVAFVNLLARAATMLARFSAMIFGTSYENAEKSAEALYNEADAAGAAGKAAKKAAKQFASFDEINKIGDDTDSSGGGGGGGGTGKIDPNFRGMIEGEISALEIYAAGAALAVGAILAFTGVNIPLGIALMAVGAATLASATLHYGELEDDVKKALANVMTIALGSLIAIGLIIALFGNPVLGLGLMVAGVAGLGIASVKMKDSISPKVRSTVSSLLSFLGASLFVLGAILTFSGANIALGIAAMAVGVATYVAAKSLDWEATKEKVGKTGAAITAVLGGALLAVGAVLAFSGVNIPLGIALMAAGALALGTAVALNWEQVKGNVDTTVGKIVAIASGALIALGLILALTGVNIPLGIALLAAGAVGLVSVTALDWNAIQNKLMEVWESIKSWFNTSVRPKLTLEYWQSKFAPIGDAFKNKIKDAINGAIALFNKFIDWVNSKMRFTWQSMSIAGKEIIPAGSVQLFTLPHIPALAQGAVIPPNREFMAVLGDQKSGTNIETPLSTMVQAFRQALAEFNGGSRTIILEVDKREFGRVVLDSYNTERQRVGVEIGG